MSIAPEDRKRLSEACCNELYHTIHALAPKAAVIGGYMPIKGEIDTMPALMRLVQHNHRTALPVITKEAGRKHLVFHPWKEGETLNQNSFGIHEPKLTADTVLPDIVIVPLLAFDRSGNRLGYGGGFYDAVLRKLRTVRPSHIAIGAAFALQEAIVLPNEAYDEPLNKIITDKEVISI